MVHVGAVGVEGLRGVARGRLDGLAPVTVLTGPNGCGKSTVLDAILLAGATDVTGAVVSSLRRRGAVSDPARWLFRAPDGAVARVTVGQSRNGIDVEFVRSVTLEVEGASRLVRVYRQDGVLRSEIASVRADDRGENIGYKPGRDVGSAFEVGGLIDPGTWTSLERSYSEAVRRGRKAITVEMLARLLPGTIGLEILLDPSNAPVLHVASGVGAVPAALIGDGLRAFLRLSFGLAEFDGGVALVEEPESFQHPAALRCSAHAIVGAATRGTQVVLTTHSLEMIDALISAMRDVGHLDSLAVFNLALRDGVLVNNRAAGDDLRFARSEIEADLR